MTAPSPLHKLYATPSEELQIRDFLPSRRRHYVVLLVAALLGIVLGYLKNVRAPILYTGTATVELNKDKSGLELHDFSGAVSQTGTGPDFALDFITVQDLLTNDTTILTVIRRLNLLAESPYKDIPNGKDHARYVQEASLPLEQAPLRLDRAVSLFRRGLHVDIVKNARLLTVSYSDSNPRRAAEIANAIVDAYQTNSTDSRKTASDASSTILAAQLATLKQHVEHTHDEIAKIQEQKGIVGALPSVQTAGNGGGVSTDPYDSPIYQRLKMLEAELTRVQILRVERESIYRLTQSDDVDVVLQAGSTHLMDTSASNTNDAASRTLQAIQALTTQEASLRIELASQQLLYGAENPKILVLNNQITAVQSQIKTNILAIRKAAKTEYFLALSTEQALQHSVAEEQLQVEQTSASLGRLAFLQQEENTSRGLYQDLYTRMQAANVASDVKSFLISVVDPARIPSRPSSPNLRNNLMLGLLGGLIFGYILVLFLKLQQKGTATHPMIARAL